MEFQQDWPKDKKITALLIFLPENLEKFALLRFMVRLSRNRQFFFVAAFWAVGRWKAVH